MDLVEAAHEDSRWVVVVSLLAAALAYRGIPVSLLLEWNCLVEMTVAHANN